MTLPNVVFSKEKNMATKILPSSNASKETATLTPTTTTTLATPSRQTERLHECVKTKKENQIKRKTV